MNAERTRKCLRQLEHMRGHLWDRYSITVNIIKLGNDQTITVEAYNISPGEYFWHTYLSFEQPSVLPAQIYILYNLWCRMLTHPKMFIVGSWSRSYDRYLLAILSYSWIFHLESDWSRCVWKTGVAWTWYFICVINKKRCFLLYFLFAIYQAIVRFE